MKLAAGPEGPRPPATSTEKAPSRWKRPALLLGLIAALLGFLLWQIGRKDREIRKIQQMQEDLAGPEGKKLSREERQERVSAIRDRIRKLDPQQRAQLLEKPRRAMRERLDRFFRMSKQEQLAFLDAEIDRMERVRKYNQARGRSGPVHAQPRLSPPESAAALAAAGSSRAPDGSGVREASSNRASGSTPPPSPGKQQDHLKKALDLTTPEGRTQMHAYLEALNARRAERGLPVMPLPLRPR